MKVSREDMTLYLVTDRAWLEDRSLASVVEDSIKGGATFVQIREKKIGYQEFKKLALEVKTVTDKYKIPFVVNDNIELAIDIDADGVHLGQDDMEISEARKLLGDEKILGISANTVAQAIVAEREGADYLGIGAIFATDTKVDALSLDMDTLKAIAASVSIPLVAIGGINKSNINHLKTSGIDGVAVVSAILREEDIEVTARELHKLVKENLYESSNI